MKSNETNRTDELRICDNYSNAPDALIEILHDVQALHGYISEASQDAIANNLNISRAEVHGVVSFYEDFKTVPPAQGSIKICRGEACQSMGANELLAQAQNETDQASVSIEAVYCLGNCALAPASMTGSKLHGQLNPEKLNQLIEGAKK